MSIATYFSSKNRDRKWHRFIKEFLVDKNTKILDIGYSDKEYSNVDNYLEKHYPYQNMITALGVEDPIEFSCRYPDINIVKYAGGVFPFQNASFDIAWSNAVLEHVGDFDAQVLFIKEIRRVAKNAFFTTPNRYFPIETHTRTPFLHWLPKSIFDKYLLAVGKPFFTGSYMYLLSESQLRDLLAAAEVKEYEIIYNRLFGFVLDFVIILKPVNFQNN
jgi:SAM-dependent methyltransferase